MYGAALKTAWRTESDKMGGRGGEEGLGPGGWGRGGSFSRAPGNCKIDSPTTFQGAASEQSCRESLNGVLGMFLCKFEK